MNKLKSTFTLHRQNSHTKKHEPGERRRSELFMKRLSSSALVVKEEKEGKVTPRLQLEELSEAESKAYQTWWKDLDPFHIGKADNATVFKFVSGCHLPDTTLEEILSLFQNQKDGLDQEEFFAMLRLIAHAQNGKTVSGDIVYLGAPLLRFQTQAIDALIGHKAIEEDLANRRSFDTIASSWNSEISSTSHHSSAQHSHSMPSWMIQQVQPAAIESSLPTTSINNTLVPPAITHTPIQHARSRSVPYANTNFSYQTTDSPAPNETDLYQFDTVGASTSKQQQTPSKLHSSHVSLDQDALQNVINNGPAAGSSLLLTQGFKPQFNDNDTSSSSNSSYQSSPISIHNHSNNPYKINLNNSNPFETDDSSNSTPKQFTPPLLHDSPLNNKTCFNSNRIPPPPVPPQSTKPPYPKYARRTPIK